MYSYAAYLSPRKNSRHTRGDVFKLRSVSERAVSFQVISLKCIFTYTQLQSGHACVAITGTTLCLQKTDPKQRSVLLWSY